MTPFTYTLLLYLASPLIWIYLFYRALRAPEYREGFAQRLGIHTNSVEPQGILVHCASVGETVAAAPLINQLITRYPEKQIIVSTSTPTGKKTVCNLFKGKVHHVYMPVDWPGSVKRFIERIQPCLVILMETELWFNFLKQCQRQKIPSLLANARLSNRSLAKYQKHSVMSQKLFGFIDVIAAQFKSDKNNYLALGVAESRIMRTGSIKFDVNLTQELIARQRQLKQLWRERRPAWIAASIHPGEFATILSTHQQLLQYFPDLLLVAVPRHPEKFDELCHLLEKNRLSYVRRSDNINPQQQHQILVGDSMGEMLLFCGTADVAYVGGSLIERGGHNPLEPLVCGIPVLMGPSYYNFSDICEALNAKNLLQVVTDQTELVEGIRAQLEDHEQRKCLQLQAEEFMQANRGAVGKMLRLVENLISEGDPLLD